MEGYDFDALLLPHLPVNMQEHAPIVMLPFQKVLLSTDLKKKIMAVKHES